MGFFTLQSSVVSGASCTRGSRGGTDRFKFARLGDRRNLQNQWNLLSHRALATLVFTEQLNQCTVLNHSGSVLRERFAALAADLPNRWWAAWELRVQVYGSGRVLVADKDCDFHWRASVLGRSRLHLELEEGHERPEI